MVKRRSPFRTVSPSLKNIPVSVPPTCARSSTCETAANWPRNPNRVSMSCTNGLLTTTCGSAAGGAPAELPLAPGEYLSHAPTSSTAANPAATDSLADVRLLIRRSLLSARWSEASSVSVIFVLLVYCSYYLHNLDRKINASFPESDQSNEPALFSRAISRSCSEPEKATPTCTP